MDIRCPNCGTSFVVGSNNVPVADMSKEGIAYCVPKTVRNENTARSRRDERMAKLKAAGIDVSAMESVFSKEQIDKFLNLVNPDTLDDTAKKIVDSGNINNPRLFRRWVMALTFKLLGRNLNSWTRNLRCIGYHYQFTMLLNEFKEQEAILASGDVEYYQERRQFFTEEIIDSLLSDYMKKVSKKLLKYKLRKNNRYGTYTRIRGRFYTIKELFEYRQNIITACENIINAPVQQKVKLLREFLKSGFYFKLNTIPTKCSAWVNAYKGAGAYYTLSNLIQFHDCKLSYDKTMHNLPDVSDMDKLKIMTKSMGSNWYRLHKVMKKTIVDNDYNFWADMSQKYSK